MTRKSNRLNTKSVAAAKTPGYYLDGAGLILQVSAVNTKSWVLRFTVAGRTREMGLGSAAEVSLAEARAAASKARALIREGIDPIEHRQQQRRANLSARSNSITFEKAAEQYIAAHEAGWRNKKHGQQWASTIETYCGPVMGKLPVSEIDTALVMRVLEPEWGKNKKTETMKRLRGRVESVLDWARVQGYRSGENPARWRGHLDKLLAAPTKIAKKGHFASMPYADLPAFWQRLKDEEGMGAQALRFTILTAARSGEVRGMVWSEVDLDQALWTIPAARMKAEREHRVPLPKEAVKLLQGLPRLAGTDVVFFAPRGGALSDMTLSAVLRRMEIKATVHGFRSTFSTWTAERTNTPTEVREACLAHVSGDKVAAAYQRGDFWAKRAKHMQGWATYCTTAPAVASVVPMVGRRKG